MWNNWCPLLCSSYTINFRLLVKYSTSYSISWKHVSVKLYLHLSGTPARVSTTLLVSLLCLLLSRMYHAEKLPRTNLVFIIADNRGSCLACTSKPITQEEKPCILLADAAVIWHRARAFWSSEQMFFKSGCFWQDNSGRRLIMTMSADDSRIFTSAFHEACVYTALWRTYL